MSTSSKGQRSAADVRESHQTTGDPVWTATDSAQLKAMSMLCNPDFIIQNDMFVSAGFPDHARISSKFSILDEVTSVEQMRAVFSGASPNLLLVYAADQLDDLLDYMRKIVKLLTTVAQLDEYIFKAITVWTDKWKRHGWRTSSGEVGHRDLWEHIDWLRGEAGDKLQVRWVPSHLGVAGNEAADELAGQGRELHPYNLLPLSKRRRVTEWDALGLEPMAEVSDSGGTSGGSSAASSTSGDEDVFLSSSEDMSFSTDVSDTRLRGAWDSDSDGFSTDVSESRKRRRGGIES